MAKNSKDAYNAVGVANALWFEPETLIVVGLDCPEAVCPALADPDRLAPGPEFPGLVDSLIEHGNKQAIQVRKLKGLDAKHAKWEGATAVVHGRQRVLAAREANKRIKRAGGDVPVRILGTVDLAPDASSAAITNIVANEHNRSKSVLERARDADRMRRMGHDDQAICKMFGVTRGALAQWRALLAAPPEVLESVERGDISASTAAEVGKLPAEQRAPVLAAALASEGGKDGGNVRERVKAARSTGKPSEAAAVPSGRKPWKLSGILKFVEFMDPKLNEDDDPPTEEQILCYKLTRYIAGESDGRDLKPYCDGRLFDWAREYAPTPKKSST